MLPKDLNNIDPCKHIIRSQQFNTDYLNKLFTLATEIKNNPKKFNKTLQGKIVALLFYEPSTRTRFSFESAVLRLGGSVITTENASAFSSAVKGETLEDTVKMLNIYADITVIRHTDNTSSERVLGISENPIINAGSGTFQHPTQSLLDMFTIYEKFSRMDNLKVAVVGDLLHGRTCSSLLYLLSKFQNNTLYLVSPKSFQIRRDLYEYLIHKGITVSEVEDLQSIVKEVDVCYMTRIQVERFQSPNEYDVIKDKYILHNNMANSMKEDSIILHPLPRTNEISKEVDANHRARYFEQANNGLWVRMALLSLMKLE